MQQRIEFIDLAKGLCISLVVLWHVLGLALSSDAIMIMFFFRMPLYFILSGLFFKTYNGIFPFIKKKTNKLLIPFLFIFLIIVIPSIFLKCRMDEIDITANIFWDYNKGRLALGIDSSAWFLVCLFIVNIIFYAIFLISSRNIKAISFLCITCGLLGFLMNSTGFYLPLWIDSSLTVMPFFLCGYLIRNYSNILYGNIDTKSIIVFILSAILLLTIYYLIEKGELGSINFFYNDYGVTLLSLYLGGITGTYCVLLLAKYLKHVPVISYIGRYSIIVLLTHQPFLFVIRNILYKLNISQEGVICNLSIFIVIIFVSIPTIQFCIKFLPYFFAQKDMWK